MIPVRYKDGKIAINSLKYKDLVEDDKDPGLLTGEIEYSKVSID